MRVRESSKHEMKFGTIDIVVCMCIERILFHLRIFWKKKKFWINKFPVSELFICNDFPFALISYNLENCFFGFHVKLILNMFFYCSYK